MDYNIYIALLCSHSCRLIRLTSPNLNYLIGIGAIILYIDISLSVVPTTNPEVLVVLCSVSSWIIKILFGILVSIIVMSFLR